MELPKIMMMEGAEATLVQVTVIGHRNDRHRMIILSIG